MNEKAGVSFVVPVYNGTHTLEATLASILEQDDGRPFEVLIVDDASSDDSLAVARRFSADPRVRVLRGRGAGAAAAINLGIREAGYPFVCQVDQDVVVHAGWLAVLLEALVSDGGIAAAQGVYVTDPDDGWWARVCLKIAFLTPWQTSYCPKT